MRIHRALGRALGLALGIALVTLAPRAGHAGSSTTIAVLYFDYDGNNEDLGFLRKGLNQMMVSDLLGTPGVTVVERVRLQEVLAELDLHKSKTIDKKSAVQVGKVLGARYLIMGGYFDFKSSLHVTVKVVDVQTSEVIGGVRDQRKVDDFLQAEQYLVTELKRIIRSKILKQRAATGDGGGDAAPAKVAKKRRAARKARVAKKTRRKSPRRPKKLGARLAGRYGKGLDAMDRGDKKTARKELEAVLKEQPDFELAQVDLAGLAK